MTAKIYRPARNAMQSGKGKQNMWYLEFERERPRGVDPLMGWTSASETNQQVRLVFDSADEAVAYAERNAIPYEVQPEPQPRPQRKTYAENFRWGRPGNWTH